MLLFVPQSKSWRLYVVRLAAIVLSLKVLGSTGQQVRCVGPDCRYACLCHDKGCVSKDNWNCREGVSCDTKQFGFGCQFVNLAVGPKQSHPMLADQNEATCLGGTKVNVQIKMESRPFRFALLAFKDESYLALIEKMEIKLMKGTSPIKCNEWVLAPQDVNTHVEFHCPSNSKDIDTVEITGDVVPLLCEVYISGGRNVALFKKTDMSSTDPGWAHGNAVDGYYENGYKESDCIASSLADVTPTLKIRFDQPFSIDYFIVRNNPNPEGIKRFFMKTFDRANNELWLYQDPNNDSRPLHIIPHDRNAKVSVISLSLVNSANVLNICELEAYGDCPSGTHGIGCEKQCSAACGKDGCTSAGKCKGCAAQKYGPTCETECPTTCTGDSSGELCQRLTGYCTNDCNTGLQGPLCDKACPSYCRENTPCDRDTGFCTGGCTAGLWGPTCSEPCPEKCKAMSLCDPVTGECEEGCREDLMGDFCNETIASEDDGAGGADGAGGDGDGSDGAGGDCPENCAGGSECKATEEGMCPQGCKKGFFDKDCSKHCSTLCKDLECNAVNGHCTKCEDGMKGEECSEKCSPHCSAMTCNAETGACDGGCKSGYYGDSCDTNCSEGCISCDKTTGFCTGDCEAGYYGDQCEMHCPGHCACDRITGDCTGDCTRGFHGEKCEKPCETNCRDSECEKNTGDCGVKGCNAGFYGNKCEQTCKESCNPSLGCARQTGECLRGCPEGFYGASCETKCSPSCMDDTKCDSVSGECTGGCKTGFYGQICDKDCSAKCGHGSACSIDGECESTCTGPDCKKDCSDNCLNDNCDRKTKTCREGCSNGFYGKACTQACPTNCAGKSCDKTGKCSGGCGAGFFGQMCKQSCSPGCRNGTCNREQGNCESCNTGFTGDHCEFKCVNCAGDGSCDKATRECALGCQRGYRGSTCDEEADSVGPVPKILLVGFISFALVGLLLLTFCRLKSVEPHSVKTSSI